MLAGGSPSVTTPHEIINAPTCAAARRDRLLHNAQRIDLAGHSLRRTGFRAATKEGAAARVAPKTIRQQDAASRRHHLGTARNVISRSPRDICGISRDVLLFGWIRAIGRF